MTCGTMCHPLSCCHRRTWPSQLAVKTGVAGSRSYQRGGVLSAGKRCAGVGDGWHQRLGGAPRQGRLTGEGLHGEEGSWGRGTTTTREEVRRRRGGPSRAKEARGEGHHRHGGGVRPMSGQDALQERERRVAGERKTTQEK